MRLIGLAVAVSVSIFLAPPTAEAQRHLGGTVTIESIWATLFALPRINLVEAFRESLRQHGYVEGQNLVIRYQQRDTFGTALAISGSEAIATGARLRPQA